MTSPSAIGSIRDVKNTAPILSSTAPLGRGALDFGWRAGLRLSAAEEGAVKGVQEPLVKFSGFASVETPDMENQRLLQRETRWDVFIGKGRQSPGPVTYEHPMGVTNVIGFPTMLEHRQDPETGALGTWVEGYLYESRSAEVIRLARTFEAAGGFQSFGMSVEGGIVDVKPNDIGGMDIIGDVLSLAITLVPQNNRTWMTLAASLNSAMPQVVAGHVPSLDEYVATFLKSFPRLSWAEGEQYVKQLLSLARSEP